jgi:2-polyprenyl-6-methoxyphenol hydroxylase-like FAD-dependent oxidoreductase
MLLARKGYRVLLADKATFPSDITRGHYIHQPGIARLKRWGLLDQLVASNCPPVPRLALHIGPFTFSGSPPPSDGVAEGYNPRRKVLDKLLVDAAVAAGAELREGFAVQEMLMDGERVTGIRGRTQGGATVTEQARLVIGADGIHSLVARTVQAPEYHTRPTLDCAYYTYHSGVPLEGAELYSRGPRWFGAVATNDGLVYSFVQIPRQELHAFRADLEGNYQRVFDLAPGLAERLRSGKREERILGATDLPNYLRKPYGPGWALVGDAGYHKDPFTAQGISDAFRDADLLAAAVDAGFSGRQPPSEALAEYERQRNAHVLPMYEFTCQLASFEPPSPEMQHLFGAVYGNQAETNRLLGTIAGTVPIPEFFSPENIGRILAAGSPAPTLPA